MHLKKLVGAAAEHVDVCSVIEDVAPDISNIVEDFAAAGPGWSFMTTATMLIGALVAIYDQ